MISLTQVKKYSQQFGVSESTIEKDYLIEIILWQIARHRQLSEGVIFRGGTCLKKVYFSDYRFSEDLDFLTRNQENIVSGLKELISKINQVYPINLNYRNEFAERRHQFFIIYNLFPEIPGLKELKIDIVEDIHIPPATLAKLNLTYPDFTSGDHKLNSYTLESIAADKIGRILDLENEPRDIYDLWYILKHQADIIKIRKVFEKKYGYPPLASNIISEIKKKEYEINWNRRLENQISQLPDYHKVTEELEEIIKSKFKT